MYFAGPNTSNNNNSSRRRPRRRIKSSLKMPTLCDLLLLLMRCCWLQSKVEDDAKTWYILLLLFEACFFRSSSPHFIVDVVVVVDKFHAILSHQSPIRGAIERETQKHRFLLIISAARETTIASSYVPMKKCHCTRLLSSSSSCIGFYQLSAAAPCVCNCVCWAFYNILFTHLKRRKCVLFPETRRTPTRYVCKNKIVIISIPIYSIRLDSPPIKNQTATTSTAGMLVIATK